MKRLIVALLLLLLLLIAGTVEAQTATPTVALNSHIFYQGEYSFSANATYMTTSGVWTSGTVGVGVYYNTVTTNGYIDFTVSRNICHIVIEALTTQANGMYLVLGDPSGGGSWTLATGNTSEDGLEIVLPEQTSPASHEWQIHIVNAPPGSGFLRVYNFRLWNCDSFPPTPTPPNTPLPTATPPNTPVPTATILPSSTPVPTVPTATILPSSTPPNTPVPTATRIASSTPGVPTATILPSSTPGVATATAINTSTPAPTWTFAPYMTLYPTPTLFTPVPTATGVNTPVDTLTPINTPVDTPTALNIDLLLTLIAGLTPGTMVPSETPTITNTPTPDSRICGTLAPGTGTPEGQPACFDYSATASDVHIANLLTLVLFSVWGFFLFVLFVLYRRAKP